MCECGWVSWCACVSKWVYVTVSMIANECAGSPASTRVSQDVKKHWHYQQYQQLSGGCFTLPQSPFIFTINNIHFFQRVAKREKFLELALKCLSTVPTKILFLKECPILIRIHVKLSTCGFSFKSRAAAILASTVAAGRVHTYTEVKLYTKTILILLTTF